MPDYRRANQQLWNEWSDAFQSLWNANTADGELPPTPSPFGPDAPGGTQPEVLESVEGMDYVELGCGGGQGSVGTATLGADTVVGVDFSREQLHHARHLRDFYGVFVLSVPTQSTRISTRKQGPSMETTSMPVPARWPPTRTTSRR